MYLSILGTLCCPMCKGDLAMNMEGAKIDASNTLDVLEGILTCTSCGETYPIAEGIPNLLPPSLLCSAP